MIWICSIGFLYIMWSLDEINDNIKKLIEILDKESE
jgi:hypothetical protein